jgi:hypothetical protein
MANHDLSLRTKPFGRDICPAHIASESRRQRRIANFSRHQAVKARETEAYRVIENLISRLFLAPRSGFLYEFVSVTVKVSG